MGQALADELEYSKMPHTQNKKIHPGVKRPDISDVHVLYQPFHRDSCDIVSKNNILLVPNLYNNYSGLVKLGSFVKVVASYVLANKGIDELLVIKINDVEFRDSRDAPRNCFSRFSRICVIS